MKRLRTQGVTIVEVIIGISIFALVAIFVMQTLAVYFANANVTQQKVRAVYLAEEGQEVMRYLRDSDWNTFSDLAFDTIYYLDVATTTLATTSVPQIIDNTYTRSVVLHQAYRNSDDDLVASTTAGASVDSGSRIVITNVEWAGNTVSLEALLANIFNI